MPKLFETIFLQIFQTLYPYIHTHLVSYCLVLILGLGVIWLSWRATRKLNRSRYLGAAFLKYLLIAFMLFWAAFLVWFVFFHFHTFLLRQD